MTRTAPFLKYTATKIGVQKSENLNSYIISGISSHSTDPYVTEHPGNCWFHKYFYKEGAFTDIYILKEFDQNIMTNFTCADGCVYSRSENYIFSKITPLLRLGDPFTTEYCFESSPDAADEALNEYIMPKPGCKVL